ncbi:MAG: hypothetical protein ACKO63_07795 [Nodosilinea sp.]|jgi:hypothetical protein
MTIEQATLERIRVLSLEKQQEVLDFADLLVWKSQVAAKHRWSSGFLSRLGVQEGESVKTCQTVDDLGWPSGFLGRIYGICADDPIVVEDN